MDEMTRPNVPAIDLTAALDPASLQWWIDYEFETHAATINALMERFIKFCDVTSIGIQDDYVCGVAGDFAKDLIAAAKALDEKRTEIKKPVLHAQRLIDGSARKLSDRVNSAEAEVRTRIATYLKMVEVERRKAAEEEAQRLAEAAHNAMLAADAINTPEADDEAVRALHEAQIAESQATAKALELTRTRGVGGALTALKDNWTYEIVALHAVPQHFLQVNDAAVRLAIKQGQREIQGLRIWNDTKVQIR